MKNAPPQPEPEAYTTADDPAPVTFLADGKLVATFHREDDTWTRSLPLSDTDTSNLILAKQPEDVDRSIATILDTSISAARAVEVATAQGQQTPRFERELAVAANTRGLRFYQAGKLEEGLALFIAAAGSGHHLRHASLQRRAGLRPEGQRQGQRHLLAHVEDHGEIPARTPAAGGQRSGIQANRRQSRFSCRLRVIKDRTGRN